MANKSKNDDIGDLANAIGELATAVDKGFTEMHERFADVDKQFTGVDKKLSGINERLDSLELGHIRIEHKLDATVEQVDGHSIRIKKLEKNTA